MIGLPPSDAGGVHETVAFSAPAAATAFIGGLGGPAGVTVFDGAEGPLVPIALFAVAVNV